ncbi:peptidylprolyl isomerase [Afifella pfennigii]|uniref:peptidylprolyl isomerase n=1 Tax=Afifella pfennigii TaxID=209897 RepID=UPI000479954D|nr:peptidylprolyl isomerase [Afifella pfennigii]
MLDRMRQATSGWTAKILLGLLVVSFGIWGVSGQFAGYGAGTLASVGHTEVSAAQYDRALRLRMQQFGQQAGRAMTLEDARTIGLTQQVLSQLVSEAALEDQAKSYNLGISDDKLASEIAADPTFQGVGGSFDRQRFQALLRNAGFSENEYIADMRAELIREQLAATIASDVQAPQPLVEALYRYQNETRGVSFFIVDESAIDPVGTPDEETLKQYFVDNQSQFRAPEYRSLGLISLTPETVADPTTIAAEEVQAAYDNAIDRFTVPQRRRVFQIRFDSEAEAQAAAEELSAGTSFETLAEARNLTMADIDLGMKAQAEFVDSAIAEAAFAAAEGAAVPVLDAPLGPAIVKVEAVEPGSVQSFAEAEPILRREMAQRRASDRVLDLYDAIEDERAAGSTLQEVANKLGLSYQSVESVAADGNGLDGSAVGVPGGTAVLADAFQSDVGIENDPIRTEDGGYVFYEVTAVTPARDRTLEEVRPAAIAAWRADETAERIRQKAASLLQRLEGGASLASLAQEVGTSVETAIGITRAYGDDASGALSTNAVAQAFAGPQGHVANADDKESPNRVLLKVESVSVPAFFGEAQGAEHLRQGLAQAIADDLLLAYNAHLLGERPVSINQAVYGQLTGQSQPQ